MYTTYPKGGKKVPSPGRKGVKSREQETDSVYYARNSITGGEEVRMRNIYENDYGKRNAPFPSDSGGMRVSPRKTMIGI